MSTVKVVNVQHPSASTAAVTLAADGSMTGAFPAPNRNLLYNGAMQLSQRGTSATGLTGAGASYETVDRWEFLRLNIGTFTNSVETDAPTGSGFRKSLKVLVTTADAAPSAGDALQVNQKLEGQDLQRIAKGTASAQQLTLSFWVKSNVTGTFVAELVDSDNSRGISASYTVSASATWERKTVTFPADTTGAFSNDNGASLSVIFWLGAGSDYNSGSLRTTWGGSGTSAFGQTNLAAATNNYWQITGVQLEVGPVATSFEFKSYGQELRECQRYYYRISPGVINAPLGAGWNTSTTVAAFTTQFPVTMRTRPTALETSGTANHYQINFTNTSATCSAVPTFNASSTDSAASLFTVASGLTAGQGAAGRTDNSNGASAYLAWSAEL